MKLLAKVPYPIWIFLCALIVRLIHIATLKEGFYFSDFTAYEKAARSLMNGEGFDPEFARPPIYPLFLAAKNLFFGEQLFPMRIIQAFLGAYCSVLIFAITERTLGRNPAHIAAWISIFYPYYVFIAGLLYPTLITTFFLISMVYFVILAVQKNSIWFVILASICLGVAALAVPVCLAFLPFLILWFLLFSKLNISRKTVFSVLTLLIVFLSLLPWISYCYKRYGRFIIVDPRYEKHLPTLNSSDEQLYSKNYTEEGERIKVILHHPEKFLGNVGREFIRFWRFVPDRIVTRNAEYREKVHQKDKRMVVNHPYTSSLMNWVSIFSYGPVFLFAIIGIFLNLKKWKWISLPLFLLLSQAFGYSLFFAQTRYRLPVEFCLMVLAGGGAWMLFKGLFLKKQAEA